MKIGIVTTFSDKGYEEYGKFFVESCRKYVDKNIELFFYVDSVDFEKQENFHILNLEKSIPDLTAFKLRNKDYKPSDFIFDAVRFSHKSYCIYHAATTSNVDLLIWLDSDTEIYDKITKDYLLNFCPQGYFSSYLGRPSYSETGFLSFDLTDPHATSFFEIFKQYYDKDEIFNLKGYLDCHVYDVSRLQLEQENKIKNFNLSPPNLEKNHFNTVFDGYMLHYKGERKSKRERQLAKALKRKSK